MCVIFIFGNLLLQTPPNPTSSLEGRGPGSLERQERGAAAGSLGQGHCGIPPAGVLWMGGLHICLL